MIRALAIAACLAGPAAFAQHEGHQDHQPAQQEGAHAGHGDVAQHLSPGSAAAPAPPAGHAADALYDPVAMAAARKQLYAEAGGLRAGAFVLELAELRLAGGHSWRFEGEGWYGGDVNRLLLRFDAATDTGDRLEHARIEALWSRSIASYWNFVAGLRGDSRPEPSRGFLAFGVAGLAPWGVEVQATAYVSDEGEVEGRFEAHGGLRLTQRWVLEPRLTLDLSLDDVPERGLGSGIPNLELGLRLRWEHNRRLVPYLGAEWQGSFGDTARYASAAGHDPRVLRFVAGLSAWL